MSILALPLNALSEFLAAWERRARRPFSPEPFDKLMAQSKVEGLRVEGSRPTSANLGLLPILVNSQCSTAIDVIKLSASEAVIRPDWLQVAAVGPLERLVNL